MSLSMVGTPGVRYECTHGSYLAADDGTFTADERDRPQLIVSGAIIAGSDVATKLDPPDADPGVAGRIWDNSGTLEVSTGS